MSCVGCTFFLTARNLLSTFSDEVRSCSQIIEKEIYSTYCFFPKILKPFSFFFFFLSFFSDSSTGSTLILMPGFYHILHVLLTLCHQMVSTLNNNAEVSCEKQRENKLMMTAHVPHSCSLLRSRFLGCHATLPLKKLCVTSQKTAVAFC